MPTPQLFDEYSAEQQAIERRRKMAQLLQQQALQPMGDTQMAGGWAIPQSKFGGLARILQGVAGAYGNNRADDEQKALGQRYKTEGNDALVRGLAALQGSPVVPEQQEIVAPADELGGGPGSPMIPEVPAVAPDQNAAMAAFGGHPQTRAMAQALMAQQIKGPKSHVVGRSLLSDTGALLGTDSTWDAEQKAAREQRVSDAELKRQETAASQGRDQQFKAEQARQAALDRSELAKQSSADRAAMRQPPAPVQVIGPNGQPMWVDQRDAIGKPAARSGRGAGGQLPTPALKLRQEELDAIGTGESIKADLSALDNQITEGKLNPSLINNASAYVRNQTGNSTENSRNIASYKATLEKLRNDSLRLNKGVQTEGDSNRAWNELISSSNDPKVVQQRLKEIQKINERAVNLRKMNVDAIHSNYGIDPMDVSGYKNLPAAVGSTGEQRAVPRTGKRVVVDW